MLGSSQQFQRNLANRLWALMFARGLVHPLDFHHRDNPPTNPALLNLLTEQVAAHGYKLRPLLTAIALSRTYQRSCEPPKPESINFADIAARSALIKTRLVDLQASTAQLKADAVAADSAYQALLAKHDAHAVQLSKQVKEVNEAHDKFKKADDAFQRQMLPTKNC